MTTLPTTLQEMLMNFFAFLPRLVVSLVIFVAGLYLAGVISRLLRRAMEKRNSDREITLLLTQLTRWTVLTLGVMVAMEQVGFDLTAFLTGLGILGFTVGFALQDVSKNFIAGLLLLLEQPFDLGDVIEVGDHIGTVAKVDVRATELYTPDGQNVIIPNGEIYTSSIKNYSRYPKRRVELTVGVGYKSDLEQVRAAALKAIADIPGRLDDPAPQVVFRNFGESSIDFTLYFWIDLRAGGYFRALDAAVVKIKAAFDAAGIEIPYPMRTVQLVSVEETAND
jgi:small conductance mechanosensitive channel